MMYKEFKATITLSDNYIPFNIELNHKELEQVISIIQDSYDVYNASIDNYDFVKEDDCYLLIYDVELELLGCDKIDEGNSYGEADSWYPCELIWRDFENTGEFDLSYFARMLKKINLQAIEDKITLTVLNLDDAKVVEI